MELMRALVLTTAAVLVVAGLAFPVAGSVDGPATGDHAAATVGTDRQVPSAATQPANDSANATAGSRLAGAFATQQADIGGELETRAVAVRLARANTTTERVAELDRLRASTEARLQSLERRRDRLRRALTNGSLSPGEYAHTMADLRTDAAVTESIADRGASAAASLPDSVATEYDVGADSFRTLENRSRNYSDGLAAAFAGGSPPFSPDLLPDESDTDADDPFGVDDRDPPAFGDGEPDFEDPVNDTVLDDLVNGTDDETGDGLDGLSGTDDNDTESPDGADETDGSFGDGLNGSDSLLGDDTESGETGESTPIGPDDGGTLDDSDSTDRTDSTTTAGDEDDGLFDG